MKAIQMSRFGGPAVFELVEIPIPEGSLAAGVIDGLGAGVNRLRLRQPTMR